MMVVAIVPTTGYTYPELLFRHKNLDYFQEKTKIKKWHRWDSNPHIHTHKAVMLPTGSLVLPTEPWSFKTFKCGLGLIYGPTHDLRTGLNGPRISRTIVFLATNHEMKQSQWFTRLSSRIQVLRWCFNVIVTSWSVRHKTKSVGSMHVY